MIFFVIILIKLIVSNGFLYSYFLNRILRELCLYYHENNNYNHDSNSHKYTNRTLILFFEFIINCEIYKKQIVSVFDFYEFMKALSILSYIYIRIYYDKYKNSNRKLN